MKKIGLFVIAGWVSATGLACAQGHIPDPGEQQDAEAAREKLLKAADQIDMIQANSESSKNAMDGMKTDITTLQQANAALKQQVAALQDALDKAEASRAKEQQVMLDEVAKMVASSKLASSATKTPTKKKDKDTPATPTAPPPSASKPAPPVETAAVGAEDPAPEKPVESASAAATAPPAASKPTAEVPASKQKGYYHVVESKETLTLICSAYRQQGVNVTVAEIRKANGLTDKSVLQIGQKLFIPKPGP